MAVKGRKSEHITEYRARTHTRGQARFGWKEQEPNAQQGVSTRAKQQIHAPKGAVRPDSGIGNGRFHAFSAGSAPEKPALR